MGARVTTRRTIDPLKIYDTLSRRKKRFTPVKDKKVSIFVCGPTVYDHAHIGHARCFVFFDVVARYLRMKGYSVFYLQNITDIAKKINRKAIEQGKKPKEIIDFYKKSFLKDMNALNVRSVNKYASASDYMKEIISQVSRLVKKGCTYSTNEGILFNSKCFRGFGKLVNFKKQKIFTDIEKSDTKINKHDFFLWRKNMDSSMLSWPSPWGRGIPGWHIEDTAITEKYFGSRYDIHGGGMDLIYPHHEAERAQMESLSEKNPFVNYWMHVNLLNIRGKKMSKSKGNCIYINNILKNDSPNSVRLFLLSKNYRGRLNFSEKNLERARQFYKLIEKTVSYLRKIPKKRLPLESNDNPTIKKFFEYIENDFDTNGATKILRIYLLRIEHSLKRKSVSSAKALMHLKDIYTMADILGLKL